MSDHTMKRHIDELEEEITRRLNHGYASTMEDLMSKFDDRIARLEVMMYTLACESRQTMTEGPGGES